MRKLVDVLKKILLFVQSFFPFLAFFNLLTWCLGIINESWAKPLDNFLGFFPHLIDRIFHITLDIFGQDVGIGYLIVCIIYLALTFIFTIIVNRLDKTSKKLIFLKQTKEIRKDIEKKEKIYEVKENKVKKINNFFGLIELKIERMEDLYSAEEDFSPLEKEMIKTFSTRIKELYPNLKISTSDKIFFYCPDFTMFSTLVNSIVKIHKYVSKLNKNLQTNLLFAIWTDIEEVKNEIAYGILKNINKLNFKNKVIVSEFIKKRYDYLDENAFVFNPLGESRLFLSKTDKNNYIDVELFYLKNNK